MESLLLAIHGLELSTDSFSSNFFQNLPVLQEQKKTAAEQLRRIDNRIFIVLSKLRYAANAIAPPNKLPPELLRAVFSHLCPDTYRYWRHEETPPYEDLLAVSRVCRHWREVSVSATELWTHIILAGGGRMSKRKERSIARLCMRRSGAQPLDFFYTSPFSGLSELIPDRRRLRSLVYGYRGVDYEDYEDELTSLLLTPSLLERLGVRSYQGSPLPALSFGTTPLRLRELTVWRCIPCLSHQLGSLTSLNLLCQRDIFANINSLLNALRCSPHLEELVFGGDFRSGAELQHPQEHKIVSIPLRSLKRLHVCHLSVETTRRFLGALDLPPNRIFMRFTGVSADLGDIFPETVTPNVSPHAATKVELVYPASRGVIIHVTNGIAYTRLTYRRPPADNSFLHWTTEKPRGDRPLKELWLHLLCFDGERYYRVPSSRALCDLETLIIEANPNEKLGSVLFPMLSPTENGVPSPFLSTLELRGVLEVGTLGEILKARSDAGSRLKTLRIMWSYGCEARIAPLAQFVDKLDSCRVGDETSRGLELPGECMTRGVWWEPWYRDFAGVIEQSLVGGTY